VRGADILPCLYRVKIAAAHCLRRQELHRSAQARQPGGIGAERIRQLALVADEERLPRRLVQHAVLVERGRGRLLAVERDLKASDRAGCRWPVLAVDPSWIARPAARHCDECEDLLIVLDGMAVVAQIREFITIAADQRLYGSRALAR